jgi:PAS domain S-box-containing protein
MKQETLTEAVGATLLQSRTDAIIVADLRGAILLWNPGAEQLFGYPGADAVGRSLRTRHWDGFHHWISTGHGRHQPGEILSVPALHRDGHTLRVQFTLTPLPGNAGATTALIAVLHERPQSPTPPRTFDHPPGPAASR